MCSLLLLSFQSKVACLSKFFIIDLSHTELPTIVGWDFFHVINWNFPFFNYQSRLIKTNSQTIHDKNMRITFLLQSKRFARQRATLHTFLAVSDLVFFTTLFKIHKLVVSEKLDARNSITWIQSGWGDNKVICKINYILSMLENCWKRNMESINCVVNFSRV